MPREGAEYLSFGNEISMKFVHPHILWLLLFLVPLIIIHLHRKGPRRIFSSTFIFWKQVQTETRTRKGFSGKKWLALILDSLFLIALIGAWSLPWIPSAREFPQATRALIVIDNSLSMASNGVPEQVRDNYLRILKQFQPACIVRVVSWSDGLYRIADGEASEASIEKAWSKAKPIRTGNNTEAFAQYLKSYQSLYDSPCFLISDGRFQPSSDLSHLILCPVENSGDNLAISDVRLSDANGKKVIEVQVEGFFADETPPYDIELLSGGTSERARADSNTAVFSLMNFGAGTATLTILHADTNPLDNEITIDASWPFPRRIGIAGEASPPLLKLLASINPAPSVLRLNDETQAMDFDLIIAFGALPELSKINTRGILFIDPPSPVFPFMDFLPETLSGTGYFNRSSVLGQSLTDLSFYLDRFTTGPIFEGASVIAEAEGSPVIAAGETDGIRYAALPFSPEQTGLTKTWIYPVLISELIDWLSDLDKRRPNVFYSQLESNLLGKLTRNVVPLLSEQQDEWRSPTPAGADLLRSSAPDHNLPVWSVEGKWTVDLRAILLLLALVVMLIFAFFFARTRSLESILRFAIMILVILALFPWSVQLSGDEIAAAFLADISPSHSESIKAFDVNSFSDIDVVEKVFIAFAEEAAVVEKEDLSGGTPPPLGENTNLERALVLAANRLPASGRRAIFLLSDGRENRGDSSAILSCLSQSDIPVYPIPSGQTESFDPRITSLRLPEEVEPGEEFQARVFIQGQSDSATLTMQENMREITFNGKGVETFTLSFPKPGAKTVKVNISTTADLFSENNQMYKSVRISGEAKISVLCSGIDSLAQRLVEAMGRRAEVFSNPEDLSLISELIIIEGETELSGKLAAEIVDAVKAGRLNVMFFGGRSLLSTKWTPLERISPVQVGSSSEEIQVFLLIDKSGSMSSERTGQATYVRALQAAENFWENLPSEIQVGVISFDAQAQIIQPLTQKGSTRLNTSSNSVPLPHGGTLLEPAIRLAADRFTTTMEGGRRIVVISDGEFADESLSAIQALLAEREIILDAFPVESEDRETLVDMVRWTGGTILDMAQIETVGTWLPTDQDSEERKQQWFSEEIRTPVSDEYFALFGTVPPPVSPVKKWVQNRIRPQAANLLALSEESSLLATMRFGLGKTGAFTLSTETMRWLENSDNASAIAQAVEWLLSRTPDSDSARVHLSETKDMLEIQLRLETVESGTPVARLAKPSGDIIERDLVQNSPVLFSESILLNDTGEYGISIYDADDSPIAHQRWIHSTPSEYIHLGPDRTLLNYIAEQTGGTMVEASVLEGRWKSILSEVPNRERLEDIRPYLLLLALLLFIASLMRLHHRSDLPMCPPRTERNSSAKNYYSF